MPLLLAELKERLSPFTNEVARSLTYESALRRLEDERSNRTVSYEPLPGSQSGLTFMWEVLCQEEVNGRLAARIHTHVCDDRSKGKLGSVWTPLCGGGWLYQDGTFEQHEMGNLATGLRDE